MKNKITRALAAFLAAAMLLTGCASNDSSSEDASSSADTSSVSSADDSSKTSEPDSSAPDTSSKDESTPDSSEPDEKKESAITPMMWEMTTDSGAKITFVGSMHALKDDAYPLPAELVEAYENADVLAVECDITNETADLAAELAQLDKMFYSDGTGLEDHLKPSVYKGIQEFAGKCNTDLSMYYLCRPWVMVALLENLVISQTDLDSSKGLDNYLLQKAHEDKKEICEIESIMFQVNLIMDLPDEICEELLESYTGENYEQLIENLEEIYKRWCAGDIEYFALSNDVKAQKQLAEEMGYPMTDKQVELLSEYNRLMLFDRNVGMAEKAAELAKGDKNVLYVVGASHFVGEKGIITLLEDKGFEVKQILPKAEEE